MRLVDILETRGVPHRAHGTEINVCCPFCTDHGESADTRFRLGINVAKNVGHCFNCGWSAKNAVKRYLTKLRIDAIASDVSVADTQQTAQRVVLPEGFHKLTRVSDELDKMAYDYLRQRMITHEQIARYRIGATFIGDCAYRVVFPVVHDNELVGYVARDITGTQFLRYKNAAGAEKGIFGLPSKASAVVLFEGIFKALRAERVLPYPCGALLGSRITESQIVRLKKIACRRTYVWPDWDSPGVTGAESTIVLLRTAGFDVRVVFPSVTADDVSFSTIRSTWRKNVQTYNGTLLRRMQTTRL